MSDLLTEIKEDIKNEKFALLWKQYGNYIIICAILVVIFTAANTWWQSHMRAKYEENGNELYNAINLESQGNDKAAIEKYDEIMKYSSSSYYALAAIKKAALQNKEGNKKDAIDTYKQVKDKAGIPEELKDLAELLYIYNLINDGVATGEIEGQLEKISKEGKPYRFSAMELFAYKKFESGDSAKAKEFFQKIVSDNTAPEGIKTRSSEMLAIIDG